MIIDLVCEFMTTYDIGSEQCAPGHSWSIGFTDRYLLHYIVKGKGKFICDGKEYELRKGNAFLITGEKGGYYEADKEDPWYYIWINFSGNMADNFLKSVSLSRENPIYSTSNPEIIEKYFKELLKTEKENNFLLSGAMFTLMGEMIKYSNKKVELIKKSTKEYVNSCKNYISVNSYKRISVDMLCDFIGLEHSYLYRLFMSEEGISPCSYIIEYKLNRAKQLLKETSLTVGEVASSVGYEDSLAFSKLFTKRTGMSPSEYRKVTASKK